MKKTKPDGPILFLSDPNDGYWITKVEYAYQAYIR